jgi:uncharacterized protein (DUF305 family)
MKHANLVLSALLLLSAPALAQMPGMKSMPGMATPSDPSSAAFQAANQKMMTGMDIPMTGDTDQDFVAGMIPHHQGAIDMAQIELKYGSDPELHRLAIDIIAAQEREIGFMTAWQKAHPPMK